ncbi:hypothetical protein OEZ85_006103 [Tetradesmus obliquus]|uniref:Uncharacterized protein n=1 Tax=Tetradesmus obliquus TaxID=3088 RepID=A0ABY8UGV0_TETOB|nr:hypothetical protein OEZ85_006103 [Tetradesmus obliquus]
MFSGNFGVQASDASEAAPAAQLQQRLAALQLTPEALCDLLLVALSMSSGRFNGIYQSPLEDLASALLSGAARYAGGSPERHAAIKKWQQEQQAALQSLLPAAKQHLQDLALQRGYMHFLQLTAAVLHWRSPSASEIIDAMQQQIINGQAATVGRNVPFTSKELVNKQQAVELMLLAVQHGQCQALKRLFRLPSAMTVPAAHMSRLLAAAVDTGNTEVIAWLAHRAQRSALPGPAVQDWVQQLMQRGDAVSVAALCETLAAEKMDPTAVAAMVQLAPRQLGGVEAAELF